MGDERQGGMQEEMDEFEVRLARSLRHVEAPEDLKRRLYALAIEVKEEKTVRRQERKHRWAFLMPTWAAGAVAAAVVAVALIGGGVHVHEKHQRAIANQQFDLAVQVTDQALQHTREQLLREGVPLGQ